MQGSSLSRYHSCSWVEAAYARSDLFERRRRLMDEWAAYLAGVHRPQPPIAEPEHEVAGSGTP